MSSRSLNKVQLIGNLTRDPELRYTPQGTAVCTFGLATNRAWTTEAGEKREEAEFHRIVAWNKLAELCSQLLFKGRRVFVEGRLQTRSWVGQDGGQRQVTEIVIEDMIILDSRRAPGEATEEAGQPPVVQPPAEVVAPVVEAKTEEVKAPEEVIISQPTDKPATSDSLTSAPADTSNKKKRVSKKEETPVDDQVKAEDIPF